MQADNPQSTPLRTLPRALGLAIACWLVVGPGVALAESYGKHRHHDRHGRYSSKHGSTHHRHHRDRRHHGSSHRHSHGDHYGRSYDRHYRYDSRYPRHHSGHSRGYYPSRRFDVPKTIYRGHARSYQDYYYGRHYDRSHRHHHEIYRFPVYADTGVEHYPYAYCEGRLYGRGTFGANGPSFSLGLRF